MVDDRTEMKIQFYEPGNWILWEWYNGNEVELDAPDTYYSDVFDIDVIDSKQWVPDCWLQFNDIDNYRTQDEAIAEIRATNDPEAEEAIQDILNHFSSQ